MFTTQPRLAPAVLVALKVPNFDDVVSALGQGLLKFVARVSEIVQGIADEFNATSSRTNGESYLLVWDISKYAQQVRHLAVATCVKILIAIERDPALREYRSHPPLRLRIPNFRLQMSIAVHEGHVFDDLLSRTNATNFELFHLLPDVHLATEIARLTKTYSCSGVFSSNPFMSRCSPKIASLFRQLDSIQLRSSTSYVDIFCLETDRYCEIEPADLQTISSGALQDKHVRKSEKWGCDVYALITQDPHFDQLVGRCLDNNTVLGQKFKRGFLEYKTGEWALAKTALEELRAVHGPSEFLLKYMSGFEYVAPKNWAGHHVL